MNMLFQKKLYIRVTDEEKNIIIKSLIELKNNLIQQGRYTDAVDDILIKLLR